MKMINNPLEIVINAAKSIAPSIEADIQFVPEIENGYGCTTFPAEGKPLIDIDAKLGVFEAAEILAHEIAHVLVGIEKEHGEEWQKAFSEIHLEYLRISAESGLMEA